MGPPKSMIKGVAAKMAPMILFWRNGWSAVRPQKDNVREEGLG